MSMPNVIYWIVSIAIIVCTWATHQELKETISKRHNITFRLRCVILLSAIGNICIYVFVIVTVGQWVWRISKWLL